MLSETLIKPLQIGNIIFPVNIIQGPLAGVSCAPFRLLTWRYGQPAFSYTEMISCKTILHQPRLAYRRYINISEGEGPVCFQLASNDPSELAEATKRVTDYGATLIDLNCGCPTKKIRRKGIGSSLLSDSQKLYSLIKSMKQNTSVPISIKIRVQGNSNENFNMDIANVIKDAGADFLTVHGRHWTEGYETMCNYNQIQFFVEQLTIPVIGNGDIACFNTLKKMLDTGCAGVMVSRAGVGQPWLIRKLIAEMKQESFVFPSFQEIGNMFVEHITQLTVLLDNEKNAILQARKLAKYYARNLEKRKEFCAAINECMDLQSLKNISLVYFEN